MGEDYEILDTQGYTSVIYLLPSDPPRICKAFNQDCVETHFPVEKAAYERFATRPQPSSILTYYGVHPSIPAGIVLELVDNNNLYTRRKERKLFGQACPDKALLYRWADQAAEALEFAHSVGVYNSDVHCLNFFLDRNWNLKVGDWAGASIGGSRPQSVYRLRHSLFYEDGTNVSKSIGISAATEIFALGTALYYMIMGHEPWPELREPEDLQEIKRRICARNFPDTSQLPALGCVISKCWHVQFVSMTEVRRAIDAGGRTNVTSVSDQSRPSSPRENPL